MTIINPWDAGIQPLLFEIRSSSKSWMNPQRRFPFVEEDGPWEAYWHLCRLLKSISAGEAALGQLSAVHV